MGNVKIEKVCTRCHRTDEQPVTDVAAALADGELDKKKAENLKRVTDLVQSIPLNERPVVMLFTGNEVTSHMHLCDGDGPKSSCVNRVGTLITDIGELPAREPKTEEEKKAAKEKRAETKAKKDAETKAAAEAENKAKETPVGPTNKPKDEKHKDKPAADKK